MRLFGIRLFNLTSYDIHEGHFSHLLYFEGRYYFICRESILSLIQMINISSLIDDTLNLEGPMNCSEKA